MVSDSTPALNVTQKPTLERTSKGDKATTSLSTTKAAGSMRQRANTPRPGKPEEEQRSVSVDRPMTGSARVSRYPASSSGLARMYGPSSSISSQRMTVEERSGVAHEISNPHGGLRRTTTTELEVSSR